MTITITKKKIRTLRMKITLDGDVLVSAPTWMRDKEINARIESKNAWITTSIEHMKKKKTTLGDNQALILGEIYTITLSSCDGQTHIDIDTKQIHTPSKRTRELFFRHLAKTYLTKKMTHRATTHQQAYNKLFIRSQSTKRGTCSSKKNIGLNRKLLTLPERIIDYIICHELAHLTHMNHSKQFWHHCTTLYPRTPEAKKWLRQHAHTCKN